MESALFRDFFGNFFMRGERYYFHICEVRFMRGEIEMNIGKFKFLFWVEGTFGGWGEVCEILLAILDGSHYQKSQKVAFTSIEST